MGARFLGSVEVINRMTVDEIAGLSNSHTQEACLKRLTPERRVELAKECEEKVAFFQNAICGVGMEACSPRSFVGNGFADPYSQLKKYSHIYTVLAGWMTKEDLAAKEYAVTGVWPADVKTDTPKNRKVTLFNQELEIAL